MSHSPRQSKGRRIPAPNEYSGCPHSRAQTQTRAAVERGRGFLQRWSERGAECKLARLLRPRSRRALAERLRRAATDANGRDRKRGQQNALLRYRVAAVRTDLLEIAVLLEEARDPDSECVNAIHHLLASRDSPLYDPGVHVSELYATLRYVRAGLERNHFSRPGIA